MSESEMLTIDESAVRMNMSVRHVRRLVAERRIAFHKFGRSVRLSAEDVAAYIDAGRVEPLTETRVWRGNRKVA
ncbi:excisionase family DNA-binding protein [Actinopolymorpha sp. B17G11]|uniref:excisionase family DNA-binding protein n=1 Tax=Actinopolymorpha sp. B17G11 TaxID=3160861 RepID=UPI0032E38C94